MARLFTVTAGLALVAVLFAGCGGGGDDSAKVEAGLRDYFATVNPEDTSFPQGAGVVPRVTTNSCKERHVTDHFVDGVGTIGSAEAVWSCVVRFGRVAMAANVVVDDTTNVVDAAPNVPGTPGFQLPPARTYTSP
jgi:hypothetical protein